MSAEVRHKVDCVYGVTHCIYSSIGPFILGNSEVYPSSELQMRLRELPKGTVVGIEDFDPKDIKRYSKQIEGKSFSFMKGQDRYWKEIKRICKEQGLAIAYLDDFPTFRRHVEKVMEIDSLKTTFYAKTKRTENGLVVDLQAARGFNNSMYRLQVEAQYIHEVEREMKIAEAMAIKKPKVAIIGLAHVDVLVSEGCSPEVIKMGVRFADYRREVVPAMIGLGDYETKWTVGSLLPEWSEPDPRTLIERKSLVRSWHAVTEGRILPDRNPAYLGTWDMECPARGLFEIYPNELAEEDDEPFSGVIEDILGTADFQGEINDTWTEFSKTYREKESSPLAMLGRPILYTGYANNGKYEGEFGCGAGGRRSFVMFPGTKLHSQLLVFI